MNFPEINARVFGTSLMVEPRKAQAFVAGFGQRLLGEAPEVVGGVDQLPEATYRTAKPYAALLDGKLAESLRSGDRSAYALSEGIAVIPVTGVLVNRGAWIGRSSGQTSYEGLTAQLEAARDDDAARGIALELDCFGGEVAGCFEFAKLVREVAAKKPVWAFVAEHAYSAAYAIASQATRIVLPATGGVGSIGVICMHADYSTALEAAGIKVSIIAAGDHKADGNPYEALPESVRENLQAEMETLRGMFADTVAAGRGDKLDRAAALATEAQTYMGAEAVAKGLADAIASPRDAFAEFAAQLNGSGPAGLLPSRVPSTTQRSSQMNGTNTPEAETPDANTQQTDTPPAQPPSAEGGADERKRIAGIVNSAEAEGRGPLANHLAFETDLSVEAAESIMKVAAKQGASGGLAGAMAGDDTEIDTPEAEGSDKRPSMAERARVRHAKT